MISIPYDADSFVFLLENNVECHLDINRGSEELEIVIDDDEAVYAMNNTEF